MTTTQDAYMAQAANIYKAYAKGLITTEEALVKLADGLGIPFTVVTDAQIGALKDLDSLGGILNEAVGDEAVANLHDLRNKLILAHENKLVLSGKKRVIAIEREETYE